MTNNWPEKMNCGLHPSNESLACCNCADGRIKNSTIDACSQAVLEKFSEEEILKVLNEEHWHIVNIKLAAAIRQMAVELVGGENEIKR